MAQLKTPHGLNLLGEEVKAHSEGSLYQVVPGDPTNDKFTEIIKKGAEKWANNQKEERN